MPSSSSSSDPFPLAGLRPPFDLKAKPATVSLASWTVGDVIPLDTDQAILDQMERVKQKRIENAAKRRR